VLLGIVGVRGKAEEEACAGCASVLASPRATTRIVGDSRATAAGRAEGARIPGAS
jgi:hypothetical protein